jgi:hypothetical protein
MPVVPPSIPDVPMTDDAKLSLLRDVVAGHLQRDMAELNARIARYDRLFGSDQNVVSMVAGALPQAVQQAHAPRGRASLDSALGEPWIGAANYAAEHRLARATQALAPIMLPAISQAVKERFSALSKAMERASPARRIGWKIKSLQTGLPLETVMEQDLDPFRVHRLLAVEMPSGNLLAAYRVVDETTEPNSANSANAATQAEHSEEEAFATAALLTALRGFVRDAGIGEAQAELSSIDIGKRTLHIGQQGSMMVAVEASGQLAHDLETSMHADLFPALRQARTQKERERVLANWRTQSVPVVHASGPSPLVIIGLAIAGLLGALWLVNQSVERSDAQRTLARLRNTPGVAAVNVQQVDSGWLFYVAADPLVQIEPVLAEGLMPRSKLSVLIDPILSLDPTSMARAIEAALPPAPGVYVQVTKTEVRVIGKATKEYVDALAQHPRVRVANLKVVAPTGVPMPSVTN